MLLDLGVGEDKLLGDLGIDDGMLFDFFFGSFAFPMPWYKSVGSS